MKLGFVVVPFLSVALAYVATANAPKPRAVAGSYAIIIDSRGGEQPLIGGYGHMTSRALYVLNFALRQNMEKVTFVRKAPEKVKPYDAVIIVQPAGEGSVMQDSRTTGFLTISYVVQKCNEPDQRGMLTYDAGNGSLGGFREMLKKAASTPVPNDVLVAVPQ